MKKRAPPLLIAISITMTDVVSVVYRPGGVFCTLYRLFLLENWLSLFTELPRAEFFSETRMQPVASLCVRTGAKRHFAPLQECETTQYVARLDRYARLGKIRWVTFTYRDTILSSRPVRAASPFTTSYSILQSGCRRSARYASV